MKKTVSMILVLTMIAALITLPVTAAEQSVFSPFDAFQMKNSSTPWSFQHATIGLDDYSDLEFINYGWFSEFEGNWAQGAWNGCVNNGGKRVIAHAGAMCDPVLTFTAPRDGNIQIPSFTAYHDSQAGDSVSIQILKNDVIIFPEDADWFEPEIVGWSEKLPDMYMTVEKGDKIYLRVNMRNDMNNDGLGTINYQIKYLSAEAYKKGVERENAIVVDKKPLAEKQKLVVKFTDIENHWGKSYIVPLAEDGIIKGKTATTFEPDANITRAEFLTLALNVADIDAEAGESYADISADAWFAKTVATAKALDLIDSNMTADGNFYPDNNITREEMTSIIVKLYESEKFEADEGDVTVFTDNATFSPWAVDFVGKAAALGVITGNPDGTFNALGNATRAEAAVIFSRFLKLL